MLPKTAGFFPVLLLVFGFGLASCSQTTEDTLTVVQGGSTDDPAPGFATVSPGSEEDFIMNVGRRVYFTKGSAELDSVARETLDIQASWLNNHPAWLVKLQGHADDGSAATNAALSGKRAEAVLAYLSSKGVSANRLWAKGYGTERLVRDCADISCKALNRRVVSNLRKEFDAAAPQYRLARQ